VIVVVGRPGLSADGTIAGAAGLIALAAASAGGRVELVGSVVDDDDGDAAVTQLGKHGIGHAAVLRDPSAGGPRLDAADLDLGLRYLTDCQVLVVAEPLPAEVIGVAVDAAAYHGAALVVITSPGGDAAAPAADLPENATLLEMPDDDGGAFATLVGQYTARLDAGAEPSDAWRDAVAASGWEKAAPE
jgi:hypothetical protein